MNALQRVDGVTGPRSPGFKVRDLNGGHAMKRQFAHLQAVRVIGFRSIAVTGPGGWEDPKSIQFTGVNSRLGEAEVG